MKNMSTGREGMVPTSYIKQEETTSSNGVEPQSAEVSNHKLYKNVHIHVIL